MGGGGIDGEGLCGCEDHFSLSLSLIPSWSFVELGHIHGCTLCFQYREQQEIKGRMFQQGRKNI